MVLRRLRTHLLCLLVAGTFAVSQAAEGDAYSWPAYTPSLNYNFKERLGTFPMPTKDLDNCAGVVGTQSSGMWTFKWGKNKRSVVTEKAITPMLARLNKDFTYFHDSMGWAPDSRVRAGYRSAVYLYGSGTCTDNADSNALGGWQSSTGGHPIILASYYPVYSFDPSCPYADRENQMGAMVHEGIHAMLASLPGARNSAWFHEGANTWVQQEADTRRAPPGKAPGPMGFLNAAAVIAPFIPIESYSGWLLDGSFGGPAAEGVNQYGSDGKQLCNWRNLLGGYQYGNMFPTFLGEWLGVGTVPWIWNYARSRVLEGMADTLGDAQTRRFIREYRARMALMDMKKWSNEVKRLANGNFGSTIKTEYTPAVAEVEPWTASMYAKTTDSSGTLVPEARTLPGWSGANYVPLRVTGNMVKVGFKPIGQNMSLLLCYRAADGTPVYGVPVSSGTASLRLDKAPVNGVVIAVVVNTDYKYLGDATRKAKYDYRLVPEQGVTGAAEINRKWYDVKLDYVAPVSVERRPLERASDRLRLSLSPDRGSMDVRFALDRSGPARLSLYTAYGALVKRLGTRNLPAGEHSQTVELAAMGIRRGSFLVRLEAGDQREVATITVVR